jgi:hypothetical protein
MSTGKRPEHRNKNGPQNPEKHVQWCTDFGKVGESVAARFVYQGVGLIAPGLDQAKRCGEGDGSV